MSPMFKNSIRTSKMTQWVKTLAYKPDNLNSIPKTHVVERETQLS